MLRGVGRCPCLFWVAISLDLLGLFLLLVGIFANVQVNGRGVGDCFIYTGAIIIFLSLIWWLSWCTGNIEVSLEELEKGAVVRENSLAKLTRKFSERLTVKGQGSPAEDSKQNKKGDGELSTASGWDVAREWDEVSLQQRQEPRYVELSNMLPDLLSVSSIFCFYINFLFLLSYQNAIMNGQTSDLWLSHSQHLIFHAMRKFEPESK